VKGRIKGAPTTAVALAGLALKNFAATAAGLGGGIVLKCHGGDCTLPFSKKIFSANLECADSGDKKNSWY
jgi:hypothetical protein